jgi:hypothetical protein
VALAGRGEGGSQPGRQPAAGRPAGALCARPGGRRPLPLASPLTVPLDAVYGLSRADASGRVTGPLIAQALGWPAGNRLTLTAGDGVVVARRDAGGMVTVLARSLRSWPLLVLVLLEKRSPGNAVLTDRAQGSARASHQCRRGSAGLARAE